MTNESFKDYPRIERTRIVLAKAVSDIVAIMKESVDENDTTSIYVGQCILDILTTLVHTFHEQEMFQLLHETVIKFEKISGIAERSKKNTMATLNTPEGMKKAQAVLKAAGHDIPEDQLKNMIKLFDETDKLRKKDLI